jgi:SAM-dependent methyltransferase
MIAPLPPTNPLPWFTPPRVDAPELLDMGHGTPSEVRRSLNDLRRINTLLGGTWSITRHLYPRLRAVGGFVTVLDVGAGSGDMAGIVARWAAHHRLDVQVVPLDITTKHLHGAHAPGVHPLQADALHLPLPPHSVDYVISSLFLHHLPPEAVVAVLRAAYRVARRGVIASDLVRGHLPELAWHVFHPFFARSYITQHDGLVSVRRAYLPTEFAQFAVQAGMVNAQVEALLPWRMTLVADKVRRND